MSLSTPTAVSACVARATAESSNLHKSLGTLRKICANVIGVLAIHHDEADSLRQSLHHATEVGFDRKVLGYRHLHIHHACCGSVEGEAHSFARWGAPHL